MAMLRRRGTHHGSVVILPLALALAGGVGACTREPAPGTPTPSATAFATPVARGEYLAAVSGCHDCHTPGSFYGAPDFERALSGSEVGWAGPWGVTYARNITPDSATGIGAWTEADIVRAIRSGYRPDGTILAPPMPWPAFARYTDEDAAALAAYLKSIPPISHEVPKALGPGRKASGPVVSVPPPPPWDAPRAQ